MTRQRDWERRRRYDGSETGGAYIKWIEKKAHAQTWAERIAERFRGGRQLPVKNSYMYCDTLDMSFFFGETGTPYMTYAGYVTADSKDITEEKLVEAFRKAGLVLETMKELVEKAGGTV